MYKRILLIGALFIAAQMAYAQDDLLGMLGDEKTTDYATNAFKGTRVINAHSMEMLHPGTMDFRILHRFGKTNLGAYQFFGLDQASMRMGFDFGLTKNLMAGFGRSTSRKELDGFVKYRFLWQSTGARTMPVSVIGVVGTTMNGLKDAVGNPEVETTFSRRLGYYYSVIVGRKFNNSLSLQLTPTLVHRNIVTTRVDPNNLYALGFGGRVKVTQRMALVWDYSYVFNKFPSKIEYNPLSVGIDIETGGHVFQLHFSNAVGMNERAFISDANSNWWGKKSNGGGFQFGFNLSRVFQLKKQKI